MHESEMKWVQHVKGDTWILFYKETISAVVREYATCIHALIISKEVRDEVTCKKFDRGKFQDALRWCETVARLEID